MSRSVPAFLDALVRKRAKGRCEYCLLPQDFQEATFHVDHVKPVKLGGKTTAENLALACVSCSLKKGARTKVKDPKTAKRIRLFNPREDDWSSHFKWEFGWRVHGKTAVGRATVSALEMNRATILLIRRELEKLGL